MLPHEFGAQPLAAKYHGCALATVADGKHRRGMAAIDSFKRLYGLMTAGDNFAYTVAVAVGTRRAEHNLALEEHRLRTGLFLPYVEFQGLPKPGSRSFCMMIYCLHGWWLIFFDIWEMEGIKHREVIYLDAIQINDDNTVSSLAGRCSGSCIKE